MSEKLKLDLNCVKQYKELSCRQQVILTFLGNMVWLFLLFLS